MMVVLQFQVTFIPLQGLIIYMQAIIFIVSYCFVHIGSGNKLSPFISVMELHIEDAYKDKFVEVPFYTRNFYLERIYYI